MVELPSNSIDRLDSIQLLRAVAAIAVITHHIDIFGNGAWGVDIFFVMSGFIMCFVTAKSSNHFFLKRIIRVVPLYWAGTFFIFTIAALFPSLLGDTSTTANITHLLKSLFFIPFQKGSEVQPLLFLGWTLNYEMFFYVIFSLSMTINQAYKGLICSVMIISLVICGQIFSFNSVVFEFYTSSLLLEFLFGIGVYSLYSVTFEWRQQKLTKILKVILTLLSGFLLVFLPYGTQFIDEVGLAIGQAIPVTYTANFIADMGRTVMSGVPASFLFLFFICGLSNKKLPYILVLLGDASYSLYLFHPYVVNIFEKIIYRLDTVSWLSYFISIDMIIICCLVSILIYKLIELPVTKYLRNICITNR